MSPVTERLLPGHSPTREPARAATTLWISLRFGLGRFESGRAGEVIGVADDFETQVGPSDSTTTLDESDEAGPAFDNVELSEEEKRRFSALVQWSYADELYAAEPILDRESATLVLRGEIDAIALPEIRSLIDLIVDGRPRSLHVDLADAAFVSVSAMLCVVDAARHIPNVVIERPSATVRRIFELMDPDKRLNLDGRS